MSAKSCKSTQYWWVCANDNPANKKRWHWKQFFNDPVEGYDWGGPHWIKSTVSFSRIERMCRGDIVVSYQAGEGIVGLVYLDSGGYSKPKDGPFNTFDLRPTPTVWFNRAVPYSHIRDLPRAKQDIESIRIWRGTVFAITSAGFQKLLTLIMHYNPEQKPAIRDFLKRAHQR